MPFYRAAVQASRLKLGAIGRSNDANISRRDDRHVSDRNVKQIRVNRPLARRQGAKLYPFNTALFYEGDRVLKVVVSILGSVRSEDRAGLHRFAVDRLDDAEFVSADLDERHFAHHCFDRIPDEMQAWFQDICLNADLALSRDNAALRHTAAEVTTFFDRNLLSPDVDQESGHDVPNDEQPDDDQDA